MSKKVCKYFFLKSIVYLNNNVIFASVITNKTKYHVRFKHNIKRTIRRGIINVR